MIGHLVIPDRRAGQALRGGGHINGTHQTPPFGFVFAMNAQWQLNDQCSINKLFSDQFISAIGAVARGVH
jgi:hypothetical protein